MGKSLGSLFSMVIGFVMMFNPTTAAAGFMMFAGGMYGLAQSLAPTREPTLPARGDMVTGRDSQKSIPLVYGQRRVGLNQVYISTSGTDNKYLHIVGIIGEGEIDSIVETDGVKQIFLDDKLYTKYTHKGTSLVYYELFTGASDQAVCTTLKNATSGKSDAWDDPLRNTAYIYIRLTHNRDYFLSVPNITVEVKGLKVLDTRTSTTAWSDNPALIAYDYMIRTSQRGGMGINSTRITTSSVDDAANYCDADGWKCNYIQGELKPSIDCLADILATFRGDVIYSQCAFKFVYRDMANESVAMNLTGADVAEYGSISSLKIKQPSVFNTPNAVNVKYPNRDNKYITDDYVLEDSTAITGDGDYREMEVILAGVTESSNAQKLASYHLEKERINKQVSFTGHSRLLALEPHDLITLTHDIPGWEAKILRVGSVTMSQDAIPNIAAIEESSLFYDDIFDISTRSWHDTVYPDPFSTSIPDVTNVSLSEEYYDYASRTFTRLKVDFDPPASTTYPYWDHAEIHVSYDGGSVYKNIGNSNSDFVLDPVEEGLVYYVKICSVNIWGVKQDLGSCYSGVKLIDGKTTVPTTPQPITAVASGDVIIITTELITDPDIIGYEVRLGSAWAGSVYFGIYQGTQIRMAGIKPGTYTLWMAPKDNRGNYSSTKLTGDVTVFYPSNYADQATWLWDFGTHGTFSNAKATQYTGATVLKCKHDDTDQLLNSGFASGIADWSTSNVVCTTLATGGVGDLECVKVECTGAATGLIYQDTTKAFKNFRNNFIFHYKVASGSSDGTVSYNVYDITNSADLIARTTLPHTTIWSSVSTYFDLGWGTTGVSIKLQITSSGKQAYFDSVSLKNSSYLEGKWYSPEYDLTDKKKERVWGDFITYFTNSSGKWSALPSTLTWGAMGSTKKWYQLNEITQAAQLHSTFHFGDVTETYTGSAGYFQITAPEVYARYYRVEVSVTDPDAGSNLLLQNLNMIAAYWTTLNT